MRPVLALLLLTACRPMPPDGVIVCNHAGGAECPDGYACAADDRCWTLGHGPDLMVEGDAGGGADLAAPTDAAEDGVEPDLVGAVPPAWHVETSGTTQALNAVWAIDANNVYAGGTQIMLRSTDGQTWAALPSMTTNTYSIWASGPTDVWAVGGGVYHSSDGTSFSSLSTPIVAPTAVFGSSQNNVLIAGEGSGGALVARSTNGGNIWTSSALSNCNNAILCTAQALCGTDPYFYALVPNFGAYQSTTSGASWAGISAPGGSSASTFRTHKGWSVSLDDVYAIQNSTLSRTTNRGSSWTALTLPTSVNLAGVWASGPNDVYVVGDGGLILHSTDGTTFTTEQSGVTVNLNGVAGSGPANVYAVGDGGTIVHFH